MTKNEIEEDILSLIDHADEMTRSDLQGCVGVLAEKLSRNLLVPGIDYKEE